MTDEVFSDNLDEASKADTEAAEMCIRDRPYAAWPSPRLA